MANTISINNLATEIVLAVKEYTEDVTEAIEKELDSTSKIVLSDIQAGSPVKTGRYRKGWKRKKESEGGTIKYIIYNKDRPFLAHLLEFGHAKVNGGRVSGKPHIRPSYDAHVPAMQERIEKIIQKGG